MSTFICSKCRTCSKFPFCTVTESKDGDCGTYLKKKIVVESNEKGNTNEYRK